MIRLAVAVMVFVSSAGAQDVPPPPKLADDGPSLADTMKFIEEKLGAIGRVNFVFYIHNDLNGNDTTSKESVEDRNVRASVQGCRIDYHESLSRNGEVAFDKDLSFALKDVQEVVVESLEHWQAGHGNPSERVDPDPPVFLIIPKKKNGGGGFYLYDESLGHRIAKALVHAVELCGGGSKDPF